MAEDDLPSRIADVPKLEELLSRPTDYVVETLRKLAGDFLVLGVGGKMGPTLSVMLRRALNTAGKTKTRVIGVSRFGSGTLRAELERQAVETIPCDLLDEEQLEKLPDAANIIYMAGMKFGATGNEPLTWAMNTLLPALVCQRFARARIAAFSTGNVYGLVNAGTSGSKENDALCPVGEYAMSCLGRERMFEYFSRTHGTPAVLIRLNYAVEMRYGVLLDIAQKVYDGREIDVSMGWANVIWQGDANAMALAALGQAASPAVALNVAGPEMLRVREVAERFGRLLGERPRITGTEKDDALLSDGSKAYGLFGKPRVSAEQVMEWVADWVQRKGPTLAKPTHFEEREGKF